MFSSRLNWSAPPNPLAKLLQEKRTTGQALLDLTESNPTSAGFEYPQDRILRALADARSLSYQPEPAGLQAARAAVADYYSSRVEAARILLTAGTSEGYAYVFKLLADPGAEVLVPRPSYPLFEYLAALESVRPVDYPLVYHGRWAIDFEALRSRVTARTRAIVLVNPNNPTGSFLKQSELTQLIPICRQHDLAIVSDEVFSDYAWEPDPQRIRSLVDVEEVPTFVLSGLSKVAGLPQLKLGWIVAGGPTSTRQQAMERLELISDTYLSVGTPVQWAAAALLDFRGEIQRQILDRVRENRAHLANRIGSTSPWRLLHAEGGWYAILEAPRIRTEEEWVLTLLAEDNVLVQPGFFYDFEAEAFLVLSLLTPPESFREGLRRILARLDRVLGQ
ncbi:MAG TPA: pyridoxal phosphate-dependent aminotransferase [Bryobacteraceae bacterium]|nr:pyridoxal phosphate-dependent aminotransferase [Bryobacteraceae bacterium]